MLKRTLDISWSHKVYTLVFGLSILSSAPAFAKNKFTHPIWKKVADLQIPAMPKDFGSNKSTENQPLRPDSSLAKHWGLKHINFFEIFTPLGQSNVSAVKPCSKDVVVAVIDTGVDYTHPELKDNLWVNRAEVGTWAPKVADSTPCRDKSCNGIDDDGNGFIDDVMGWDFVHNVPLPFDTHGHGTHIAGIIASQAGNGFGIAGVCSNASIMALKYYDNSVLGYNNLKNTVKAIEYAVANGAHIINYSGGGSDPAPMEAAAINKAAEKGVLFVAASGNDGRNNDWMPYYPASYAIDNIISVASLGQDNKLLSSSNFGKKTVDVAAPGLGILSTLPSGRFGTMSGTSQATAFVTGQAALLASQQPITSFRYQDIREWIIKSGGEVKGLKTKSFMVGGGVNIPASLKLQAQGVKAPSVPSVAAVQSEGAPKRPQ